MQQDADHLYRNALRRIAELEATLDVIRTECKRATDQVMHGRVLKRIAARVNLVRVTRGGEDVWLPSRELSVADVTSLHAMCKAAEIHATKAKRRNSVR
jgi:hypothetical protein